MTATVTSLGSHYASIVNDMERLTKQHARDSDASSASKLILRAAALNARLHGRDADIAETLRFMAEEIT